MKRVSSGDASAPLSGLRVIVTRPQAQAGNLCLLLEAQGAEAVRLPLFSIEPCGDPEQQRQQLDTHRGDDGWIFTSANAVRGAQLVDPDGRWPTLYAVGSATGAALLAAGHPGALAPELHPSSETLLALPPLQSIAGQRFLIVTGEGGRDLLASELRRRGAVVDILPLYRRLPTEHDPARIEAEVALADAMIIASGEALERMWSLVPEALRPAMQKLQLVVPSLRVLETARALGFSDPQLSPTVSDEANVRCLIQWRVRLAQELQDTRMSDINVPLAAPPPTGVDGAGASPAMAPPSAAIVPVPSTRGGGVLAWLLVLVLAGALGYGGWLLWDLRQNQSAALQDQDRALRRLARQTGELESQTEQMATRQSDLARVAQRSSDDLLALQSHLNNNEQLMGRLTQELEGGRGRFALASVEQLLLLANDRLLLERDVRSALLALQLADERLASLNDPRVFRVRQAIAQERTSLQALPRPDLTSASLTLSSLIDRADSLPLRARVEPRRFGGDTANPAGRGDERWWDRVWQSLRLALGSLFVIHRQDNATALRLLPVEDEAVIVHVLILKLESARVALLRGETASFRESLRSAAEWLGQFFRDDDAGVEAARGEIERLQPLELSASPPDLSGSLTLLRQILDPAPAPSTPPSPSPPP